MKRLKNKNFWTALGSLAGTITCTFVVYGTLTGELQKVIPFKGVGEEIFFTLIVLIMGLFFASIFVSSLLPKD
jgi:hypothetical protein